MIAFAFICAALALGDTGVSTTQPSTRPALLTVDLTTKPAKSLQSQLDSRLPNGSLPPLSWRDKPIPPTPNQPLPRSHPDPSPLLNVDITYPPLIHKDQRPGLLVYISPGDGSALREDYLPALAKRNLILAVPRDVGNARYVNWRLFAAVMSTKLVNDVAPLDEGRIYISGMSGGGKIACMAGQLCPDFFSGVLTFSGPAIYKNLPAGRNQLYPGFSPKAPAALIDQARDLPFVFVTGTRDFNRNPTLMIEAALREDGFTHTIIRTLEDQGHSLPSAEAFEAALGLLDDPALAAVPSLLTQAQTAERQNKPALALRLYQQAYGRNPENAASAPENIQRLLAQKAVEQAGASTPQQQRKFAARWSEKPAAP